MTNTNQQSTNTAYYDLKPSGTFLSPGGVAKPYVTPGRILRSLKGHKHRLPTREEFVDEEVFARAVTGEVIYRLIAKHYLPFVNGGRQMHFHSLHKADLVPALGPRGGFTATSSGVWSIDEAMKLFSVLPTHRGGGSRNFWDHSNRTFKDWCEFYAYIAIVLFPSRMRMKALKVLLTQGPKESTEETVAELLAKLCVVHRKVYHVDLIKHRSDRSLYYLSMWGSVCPLFHWNLRRSQTNFAEHLIRFSLDQELDAEKLNSRSTRVFYGRKDEHGKVRLRFDPSQHLLLVYIAPAMIGKHGAQFNFWTVFSGE